MVPESESARKIAEEKKEEEENQGNQEVNPETYVPMNESSEATTGITLPQDMKYRK